MMIENSLLLMKETLVSLLKVKEKTNLNWDEFLEEILKKSECIDEAKKFIDLLDEDGYEGWEDTKTLIDVIYGYKLKG